VALEPLLRQVDLRTAPLLRTGELRGLLPHAAVDVEPSCPTESRSSTWIPPSSITWWRHGTPFVRVRPDLQPANVPTSARSRKRPDIGSEFSQLTGALHFTGWTAGSRCNRASTRR
jgi:hypothetical protein